jgi:hypothetical protein
VTPGTSVPTEVYFFCTSGAAALCEMPANRVNPADLLRLIFLFGNSRLALRHFASASPCFFDAIWQAEKTHKRAGELCSF